MQTEHKTSYCDQKVNNQPLFFFLFFARIGGKWMHAKDQKQTIYSKSYSIWDPEGGGMEKEICGGGLWKIKICGELVTKAS